MRRREGTGQRAGRSPTRATHESALPQDPGDDLGTAHVFRCKRVPWVEPFRDQPPHQGARRGAPGGPRRSQPAPARAHRPGDRDRRARPADPCNPGRDPVLELERMPGGIVEGRGGSDRADQPPASGPRAASRDAPPASDQHGDRTLGGARPARSKPRDGCRHPHRARKSRSRAFERASSARSRTS